MFVAPSPKLQTVTRPSAFISEASANPLAIGRPAPTSPVVTISPDAG